MQLHIIEALFNLDHITRGDYLAPISGLTKYLI